VKSRLIGLTLSVLVHAALIVAVIALVRIASPPVLFVDLAHGLDLAGKAVADLGRAVADARSRGARRVEGRAKAGGESGERLAPARAVTPSPPSATSPEPPRAEAPAPPPEPVRPAPEPPPPPTLAPAPSPRVVEVTPSASTAGDSAAPVAQTDRSPARSAGGGDSTGHTTAGAGASGATVTLSDGGGSGGQVGGTSRAGARDGGQLALAVPGGGGDPAAADYAGYYDTLRRRLHESLTYPALARRRGLSGTVIVDVEVDASGKVGRVSVVTSSSHAVLDEAALEAMRGVSRVPFPPGVPPRRLLVRLPVVFEMH
jgi:protein TonB